MSRSLKVGLAAVVILVLVGGVLAARRGAAEPILVPNPWGGALLHFDPARIAEERLLGLALLSPHVAWTFPPSECVVVNDDEHACDPDAIAPDLFEAENELFEVEEMLADVGRLRVPPQLEAVFAHIRREAAFHVCLRRAELEYYRGDDAALAVACEDVVAIASCPAMVADGVVMRTLPARHRLAGYAWRECMSEAFRRRHGEYPIADWQSFLDAYGIEEEALDGC